MFDSNGCWLFQADGYTLPYRFLIWPWGDHPADIRNSDYTKDDQNLLILTGNLDADL